MNNKKKVNYGSIAKNLKGTSAAKKNFEDTMNFYSEDAARHVVGRLFDDYVKGGEQRYYGPPENSKTDWENNYSEYDDRYYDEQEFDDEEYEQTDYSDEFYAEEEFEPELEEEFEPERRYKGERYNYEDEFVYTPRRSRVKRKKGSTIKKKQAGKKVRTRRDEHYDEGFMTNEELEGEYTKSPMAMKIFVVIIICMSLTMSAVLIKKINSLSQENQRLTAEADNNSKLAEDAENMKSRVDVLTEENQKLKKENEDLKSIKIKENVSSVDENNNVDDNNNDNTDIKEYTVESGDTLWKISEKVLGDGKYYQDIMNANGMKSGDTLYKGQKLKIPIV